MGVGFRSHGAGVAAAWATFAAKLQRSPGNLTSAAYPFPQPSRHRLLRVDQVRVDARLDRLTGTILDAPAGHERAMHDDAEVRPGVDHLAIAERLSILAQVVEIGRVWLGLDPQGPGDRGEGMFHAGIVPVDDHDDRAVAVGQAAQDGRELVERPAAVPGNAEPP